MVQGRTVDFQRKKSKGLQFPHIYASQLFSDLCKFTVFGLMHQKCNISFFFSFFTNLVYLENVLANRIEDSRPCFNIVIIF